MLRDEGLNGRVRDEGLNVGCRLPRSAPFPNEDQRPRVINSIIRSNKIIRSNDFGNNNKIRQ